MRHVTSLVQQQDELRVLTTSCSRDRSYRTVLFKTFPWQSLSLAGFRALKNYSRAARGWEWAMTAFLGVIYPSPSKI